MPRSHNLKSEYNLYDSWIRCIRNYYQGFIGACGGFRSAVTFLNDKKPTSHGINVQAFDSTATNSTKGSVIEVKTVFLKFCTVNAEDQQLFLLWRNTQGIDILKK
ncbi:unnamed protein product [Phytophthora fragariaefolia]|uniref:Unnamed protein product n=1 Tax=Phytophthora fragariaefolia TaxID=1490495 RepID=A0A9W6Y5G9_9STRA|nr:unnamed protein product [Phytophthora fragariaefolia]